MVEEIFANRLKTLRTEKSMTQEELAQQIGLTQRKISKLEKLQLMPSPEIIANIAKFFEVSADYMLGLSNDNI